MMRFTYTGSGTVNGRALATRPSQSAVIAFINDRLAQGVSPTTKEICAHMGWKNLGSARNCLRSINARGLLPAGYDRTELNLRCSHRGKRVLTMNGWEAA